MAEQENKRTNQPAGQSTTPTDTVTSPTEPVKLMDALNEEERLLRNVLRHDTDKENGRDKTSNIDGRQKSDESPVRAVDTQNLQLGATDQKAASKLLPDSELSEKFEAKTCSDFHARHRSALCLSGGGIRSATFSLGVLQGLARNGVLKRFDYLSTVSGGGFIGSWLSRWIHESKDEDEVTNGLSSAAPNVEAIGNLREFSNYLSPQRGMTQDGFTLAAIFMRNLFLNWLVLVPILLSIVLFPRLINMLYAASLTKDLSSFGWESVAASLFVLVMWYLLRHAFLHRTSRTATFKIGALPLFVSIVLCSTTILNWVFPTITEGQVETQETPIAIIDMAVYSTLSVPALLIGIALIYGFVQGLGSAKFSEATRERASRDIAALLTVALFWAVLFAVTLLGPIALLSLLQKAPYLVTTIGGLAGVAAAVFGYFGGRGTGEPSEKGGSMHAKFKRHLMPILAGVFLVLLGTGASTGSSVVLSKWFWSADEGSAFQTIKKPDRDSVLLNQWFTDVNEFVSKTTSTTSEAEPAETSSKVTARDSTVGVGSAESTQDKPDDEKSVADTPLGDIAVREAAQSLRIQGSRDALRKVKGPRTVGYEKLESLKNLHKRQLIRQSKSNQAAFSLFPSSKFFLNTNSPVALWFLLILLAATAVGLSRFFGANRFSLHAMYENRLVRAYLAAARKKRPLQDPSTGFDPDDDLALASLKGSRPLHVVNATLNVAGGSDLARQSRKGASFTFSKLHTGSDITGYQRSSDYADDVHMKGQSGITLGKAMSISGAAVSPAMGYHSSKLVGAVLAFFNARLGWWLPNPGEAGRNVWSRSEPKVGIVPLLRELTGRANDESAYVYVSDGGHFENLGLYEMVRRRCQHIVVVDAGQDVNNQFESLSSAIRMIRVDFGIDITFDVNTGPQSGRKMDKHYAIGNIGYRAADKRDRPDAQDGVIIYIKPVLTGDEPVDLVHYAKKRLESGALFPQETTADQFFDEAQFESYRKLGLASVEAIDNDVKGFGNIKTPNAKLLATRIIKSKDEKIIENSDGDSKDSTNSYGAVAASAKTLAELIAPASTWIGPAVASTIAASAVVALTVTVVAPEAIALKAPVEAITLELPKTCVTNSETKITTCGQLGADSATITLSDQDRKLLKRLMREPEDAQTSDATGPTPGGIALANETQRILKIAIGESASATTYSTSDVAENTSGKTGLTLNNEAITVLQKAVDDAEGVQINRNDLAILERIVAQMSEVNIGTQLSSIDDRVELINKTAEKLQESIEQNLGPIDPGGTGINQTMKDIEVRISDGFDGLRNDSGGSQ